MKKGGSDCWGLGKGGFGVIYRQILETTGNYCAVREIDKRVPYKIDYSSKFLVMAISAKVCFLTPRYFALAHYSYRVSLFWPNTSLFWRPSLFIESPGWLEEPDTLYSVMGYLGEGDLT